MISTKSQKRKNFLRKGLLDGIAISKKGMVDLTLVWSGTLLGALAGIVAQILIARVLGTEDYGIISSALGLIALTAPLGLFGTTQYWLKAFGEEGWGGRRWLRPSLRFLMLSMVLIVIALTVWGVFGPNDSRSQFVILTLLPVIISMVAIEIVESKYQLEQRYASFAILGAATPLLRLVVALGAFFVAVQAAMFWYVTIGYMLVSIAIFFLLLPQLQGLWSLNLDLKGHASDPSEPPSEAVSIAELLSQSWVFGIAGLLYLAWGQGHVVIAKYVLGSYEAGIYNAALIFLNAVCLLPTTAFSKFFLPKIHRWAAQDFEKLKRFSRLASISMFAVGIVTAFVMYFFALLAIRLTFGPEYDAAASVLQVLALTLPMRFLGYNAGSMLRTKRFMQIKIVILFFAVALNIGLAVLLMPRWGLLGLAGTVFITEFFLVSAYVFFIEVHYFRE